MNTLIYGLITGILFGVLLQRGRVIRYDVQVGALLLKDATIIKFMFTAVLVGMVGIYMLKDVGLASLLFMPTVLGRAVVGGMVFGIGWALFGYCPGTSFGALGEGRTDAAWGILGMLSGAAVFAEVFPFMRKALFNVGNLGSLTVHGALGVGHWTVITIFIAVGVLLVAMDRRRKKRLHEGHDLSTHALHDTGISAR